MKVLLINGSPHEKGCTYTALEEIAKALNAGGVDTELLWQLGKCVHGGVVNEAAEKARACDGLIVGSPVHYAAASGTVTCFLDRLFYSAGRHLRYKPGAAIVSARRAGTTAALDQLNKYFTINQMPIVSSRYWNMVHGSTPDDVRQDEEGMSVMRTLGHNMAWLLKSIEAGRAAGVPAPVQEPPARTNFIR